MILKASVISGIICFCILFIFLNAAGCVDSNNSGNNNSIFEIINNTLKGGSSSIESNNGHESIHGNISSKIKEISLVKYAEPEKDESIRDFFAKEINSSVSIEPVNVSSDLKKEIYTIILDSLPYGGDTGNIVEGFDAKVYPLIVDEDIGNPGYLSRKNGIKISFLTDSGTSPVGNSIWAYERYATNIIRQIYKSRYGEEMGFVSVMFVDGSTEDNIILLTLNADDAVKYTGLWDDADSYICSAGWSEITINDSHDISFYERSEGAIYGNLEYESAKSSLMDSDEYFKNYIAASYSDIMEGVNNINKYSKAGDYRNVISSSDNLNKELYAIKTVLKGFHVSSGLKDTRNNLLDIILELSDAVSEYWYWAEYSDNEALLRASAGAKSGLEKFNSLAAGINIEPYDAESVIDSKNYQYLDAHPLYETFKYRDESKSSDISVKIEDWDVKTGILTKNMITGEKKLIQSEYNTEYLIVSVDFTHLGYRGGGTDVVMTPAPDVFTLYYDGNEYKPLSFTDYLQNSGIPYLSKKLERREVYESVLVFEINKESPGQSFNDKRGFVSIDLGDYGVQTWSLEKTMS